MLDDDDDDELGDGSTIVNVVPIETIPYETVAHPALIVTSPDPDEGIVIEAEFVFAILEYEHPPDGNFALVASKMYSPVDADSSTVNVSPDTYESPEVRVVEPLLIVSDRAVEEIASPDIITVPTFRDREQ